MTQPESPPPRLSERQKSLILVAAAGLLIMLPGLFMGIHADDWFQLRSRTLAETFRTFLGEWNRGERGTGHGFYRPLSRLSFSLDSMIFGLSAVGFHLTNGLLLIATTAGIWLCGERLTGGRTLLAAVLAILFFAWNPLIAEAHYWLSGRTDLLAAAFGVWGLYFLLKGLETNRWPWTVLSLVLMTGSLFSKEVGLSLVLIFPLAVVTFRPEPKWRRNHLVLCVAPLVIGFVYLAIRSWAIGGIGGYYATESAFTISRLFSNLGRMLSAISVPWQVPAAESFTLFRLVFGLGGLLILMLLGGFSRPGFFGLAAMLLALLPMAGLEISPMDGTRVLALPLVFFVIAVAGFLSTKEWGRLRHLILGLLGLAIFFGFLGPNVVIMEEFLKAGMGYRAARADWEQLIEEAPGDAVLILSDPETWEGRRILHPGTAALMGVLTLWMKADEATWRDASDPEIPRAEIFLERPGKQVLGVPFLQAWIKDDPIINVETGPEGDVVLQELHLVSAQDFTSLTLELPPVIAGAETRLEIDPPDRVSENYLRHIEVLTSPSPNAQARFEVVEKGDVVADAVKPYLDLFSRNEGWLFAMLPAQGEIRYFPSLISYRFGLHRLTLNVYKLDFIELKEDEES